MLSSWDLRWINWDFVFFHLAINNTFFNSSDSSCACLNNLAFLACLCSSNRFFFFDAKISFNLSKFLLVESNLLLVSFFLALIPDMPAASSNIFLRSIGF